MANMTLGEFDTWARSLLNFEETDGMDAAMNGLQAGDAGMEIRKIAFAVDACMDSFKRSRAEGAQMLFVHHGLFWGPAQPLTGVLGSRVRYLMNNSLGLYACHLPLDSHPEVGNNARIAAALNLRNIESFGNIKGRRIGCKGRLPESADLESLVIRLFGSWDERIDALRFGPERIRSVAMISGGGTREVSQAVNQGIDLYITGDSSHNIYHECREAGINVLFAGHYLTETFGVQAVGERVRGELGLETVFIDIPTGY